MRKWLPLFIVLIEKNNKDFSKSLLRQESALIWIVTISFIILAYICVIEGFTGSLPWLAAMVSFPWGAYGVSQVFYYKKALAENTKDGIKFETVMNQIHLDPDIEEKISETEEKLDGVASESNLGSTDSSSDSEIDIFGPI